jgi:hypothetical protein
MRLPKFQRCADCGGDAADTDHMTGFCPGVPPMTRAQLLELALKCEAGWRKTVTERNIRLESAIAKGRKSA